MFDLTLNEGTEITLVPKSYERQVPPGWTWICDIKRPGELAICLFFTETGCLRVQEEGGEWPDSDGPKSIGSTTILF